MIKLIDVKQEIEEDVTFGTCELCMSVGNHHTETLIFKDDEGDLLEVETGYWDWGDYNYKWLNISNVMELAQWFIDNPVNENFKDIGDVYMQHSFINGKIDEFDDLEYEKYRNGE